MHSHPFNSKTNFFSNSNQKPNSNQNSLYEDLDFFFESEFCFDPFDFSFPTENIFISEPLDHILLKNTEESTKTTNEPLNCIQKETESKTENIQKSNQPFKIRNGSNPNKRKKRKEPISCSPFSSELVLNDSQMQKFRQFWKILPKLRYLSSIFPNEFEGIDKNTDFHNLKSNKITISRRLIQKTAEILGLKEQNLIRSVKRAIMNKGYKYVKAEHHNFTHLRFAKKPKNKTHQNV
ncbi:hypothetical protein M0811_04892 [Anaeramoeba ignava]|uniref:Uncharacterized protein n=1 Tax=Anaeramoeba ignava TaxID=1746090 RepID=A0A9Q0RFV2_ANAIG|nr:hypothetical protein M0811_04892 [Anaeramoeba ignava]